MSIDIIVACCVCHSIKRRDNYVYLGEEIYEKILDDYNVSHSYCIDCAIIEKKKIKQYGEKTK